MGLKKATQSGPWTSRNGQSLFCDKPHIHFANSKNLLSLPQLFCCATTYPYRQDPGFCAGHMTLCLYPDYQVDGSRQAGSGLKTFLLHNEQPHYRIKAAVSPHHIRRQRSVLFNV